MLAIAFDLVVAETQKHHPRGVAQAYADIRSVLARHDFDWIQGSVYVSKTEDLAKLFAAITALKALAWFLRCVRACLSGKGSFAKIVPSHTRPHPEVSVHL